MVFAAKADRLGHMRRVELEAADGERLARAVRGPDGTVLLAAGTRLDAARIADLRLRGLETVAVLEAGERPAHVPSYMDRYESDFSTELHRVFHDRLHDPLMRELFDSALRHAAICYGRYRLGHDRQTAAEDADAG